MRIPIPPPPMRLDTPYAQHVVTESARAWLAAQLPSVDLAQRDAATVPPRAL